jgi:hypothetical protein
LSKGSTKLKPKTKKMLVKGKDLRLPKRFKAKWLENLTSGKFKQGRSYLAKKYKNKSEYCCLGVAGKTAGHSDKFD